MKFVILFACIAGISVAFSVDNPKNRNKRLINGAEIPISKAPYHVSVQTKSGAHLCGGTIIGNFTVLTTAECAQRVTPATHQIRYNTNLYNWGGNIAKVSEVYIHPEYRLGKLKDNIALINIVELFPENTYESVTLRCGFEVENEQLKVSGWGTSIDNSGLLSAKLHQVTLPYAKQNCSDFYSTIGIAVEYNMFCAGNLETGGSGICIGDEGGAAVKEYSGYHIITGVASYQYKCGEPWRVSLFTRVSQYRRWIMDVVSTIRSCAD